jgi:hypothetical protein
VDNNEYETDLDNDNQKLNLLEEKMGAFRDLRVDLIDMLEKYVDARILTLSQAVLKFEKATMLPRESALKYLKNMSREGSPFKAVNSLRRF